MIIADRTLKVPLRQAGARMPQRMSLERKSFFEPGLKLRMLRISLYRHDADGCSPVDFLKAIENGPKKLLPALGLAQIINCQNYDGFDVRFANPLWRYQLGKCRPSVKRIILLEIDKPVGIRFECLRFCCRGRKGECAAHCP